jgi:hypothetical protein
MIRLCSSRLVVVAGGLGRILSAAALLLCSLNSGAGSPFASANVQFESAGDKCLDWVTFAAGKLVVQTSGRAVLISVVPRSASPADLVRVYQVPDFKNPFSVSLSSTKSSVHNRWEVRYMRDATLQVGAFAFGESTAAPVLHASLPLTLIALDEPPAGTHTYTAQIRFVGDRTDGDTAQIRFDNARIVVVGL